MSDELAEGWVEASLGDCVTVLDARRVPVNSSERNRRKGQVPYFGATGQVGWIDDYLFDEEILLLGEDGAPFLDKSKSIAYLVRGKSWVNNHAHVLKALACTTNEFLKYALDAANFDGFVNGTTRLKLTQGAMVRLPVRVPPLAEQRRIVESVNALLGHANAARARLAKIPAILKRFRQSVLAAACTGKLSEDWRNRRHDTVTSVRRLELIREARLRAWKTAERMKLALRGRAITEAELRARYRQPDEAEAAFETPESWVWSTLDELTLLAGGLTKGQKRHSGARLRSVPYLRVANVQRGHLDLTLVKDIPATEDEIADLRLERGDILLNEGGDIDKLGRGWVWDGEIAECIHQNHVFRARPASKLIEPQFVSHYANTFGQQFFLDAGAQTVNLASVSMSKIRGLPVPVPPVDEQREILRRVKALFSLADTIERRVAAASARADALTQAIIAKAFRGELVPTEADLARAEGLPYEPAEVLLARTLADRAASRSAPKLRQRPAGRARARP